MKIQSLLAHPKRVIISFLWIGIAGVLAFNSLERSYLPLLDMPTLVVSSSWPTASATEIERLVSIPLEEGLSSLGGLWRIETSSRQGLSLSLLTLQWGTDLAVAGTECREIIDSQYQRLPEEVQKPQVFQLDPNQQALMVLGITPGSLSGASLRRFIAKDLKTELQRIQGVGSVVLVGGQDQEMQILVNPSTLAARHIPINQIAQAIASRHQRVPLGLLQEGSREFLIIGDGEVEDANALENLSLGNSEGGPLHLGDLASAQIANAPQRSFFALGKQAGIGLIITQQSGADPVAVADALSSALGEIQDRFGSAFEIQVVADESKAIREAITDVYSSIALGALIAFLVVLILTRDWRFSSVLLLSIPASLLLTAGLMKLCGVGLNIMSLGGLAIAVGNLVDNSVVLLEAIQKQKQRSIQSLGPLIQGLLPGIIGGTATSIVVFIPIMFMPNLMGSLYRPLAIAICLAQLASVLVALSLIPVVYLISTRKSKPQSQKPIPGQRLYQNSLKAVLRVSKILAKQKTWISMLLIGLASLVALSSLSLVPLQLAPPQRYNTLEIEIKHDANANFEQISNSATIASRYLDQQTWIKQYWCRAGGESNDLAYASRPSDASYLLHYSIQVVDSAEHRGLALLTELKQGLEQCGLKISSAQARPGLLTQLLGLSISTSQSRNLQAKSRGELDQFIAQSQSRFPAMLTIRPLAEHREFSANLHTDKIRQLGLDSQSIVSELGTLIQGALIGQIKHGDERIPMRLKADPQYLSAQTIATIPLELAPGVSLGLGDLATVEEVRVKSILYRLDRLACVTISLADDQLPVLDQFIDTIPSGIICSSPDAGAITENLSGIIIILGLSLLFLYLYIAAQFESFKSAVLILASVPLGIPGAICGLILVGEYLHIHALLGLIVLVGVMVNNAILLHEGVKENRASAYPLALRVYQVAISRFRPIVLTTLTTVLALIPLASGLFGPSEQQGMSSLILGGLTLATLLTLFVIPLLLCRGKS